MTDEGATHAAVLAYFAPHFAAGPSEALTSFCTLASAQLALEELMEQRPGLGAAIHRPKNAAGPVALRAMLAAAKSGGVLPDEGRIGEFGAVLAEGGYIVWPPQEVASEG